MTDKLREKDIKKLNSKKGLNQLLRDDSGSLTKVLKYLNYG